MNRNDLDALLADDPVILDAGFTEGVTAKLPRRRRLHAPALARAGGWAAAIAATGSAVLYTGWFNDVIVRASHAAFTAHVGVAAFAALALAGVATLWAEA
jgi:hypothetical protein